VNEPVWVTDLEAVTLNHRLTTLFGGLGGGARDENLLRAALARPINKWHYEHPRPDLFDLAAAYAFAIARGHVFLDGNKRTAHAWPRSFSSTTASSTLPGKRKSSPP
jgi:death-on-curing protein